MALPNTDPVINPILQAAQVAAARASTRAEVAAEKQEAITEETLTASGIIQESIQEQARDVNIIKGVGHVADLKAQNARIATFEAAGGIEFQTELMSAYAQAGKDLIAANKTHADAQARPVEGLVDYFRKAQEVSDTYWAAENAQNRRDDIGTTITGINTQQESITRAVETTKVTTNIATIEAGQRAVSEQAQIDAATASLDALAANAVALRAGMAAEAANVNAKIDLVRLQYDETNQKAREEAHAFSVKQHEFQLQAYADGAKSRAAALELQELNLEDIKDPKRKALLSAQRTQGLEDIESGNRFKALYSSQVQIGQTVTGLPVEDVETITRLGIEASTAKERAKYEKLRQIGAREDHALGLSVADALETISITGADPEFPPVKLLISLAQSYNKASLADPAYKPPKTQEELNTKIDLHAKPIIASWREEIRDSDESNPFHAPPMSVLVERQAVQDSKLYKTVLAPMEMKEFDDKAIYTAALTGIAAKQITLEEAATDIQTIFAAAADHNNETKMFARAGMKPQSAYRSQIIDPSYFSNKKLGAAAGAAVPLLGAPLLATPPGAIAVGTAMGLSALAGSMTKNAPPAITDSMNKVEIMQALVRLTSAGGLF